MDKSKMNKQQRRAYGRERIRQQRTQPPKVNHRREAFAHKQKIDQIKQARNVHDTGATPTMDYCNTDNRDCRTNRIIDWRADHNRVHRDWSLAQR